MSLYASQLVGPGGRVLAFEPHPVRAASLALGIAINHCTNISLFNVGLGAEAGPRPLYTNRVSPSLVAATAVGGDNPSVIVKMQSLQSVLEAEHIGEVRMMKIDVEGFELEVLRGGQALLKSDRAPIICMEHEMYKNSVANLEFLKSLNDYRFYNLRRRKGRNSKLFHVPNAEEVRRRDNVFCFLPGHLAQLKDSGLFE